MRTWLELLLVGFLLSMIGACSKDELPADSAEPVREPGRSSKTVAPSTSKARAPAVEPSARPTSNTKPPRVESPPPQRVWGRADVDPGNDDVVAPPDPVPDCHDRLRAADVKFRPAKLPLRQVVEDVPTCGAHDAVTFVQGPLGVAVRPPAAMTCQMALGMVAFENLIQEFAERELGQKVRSIHQGGTYSCRKMARFNLVSEHSYGNAIDVLAFTLDSGKKVSVSSHFGPLDAARDSLAAEARFLRQLSSAAYDRDIFSVSLGPYWDALHADHFHFDMARYRVDGTRRR